MIFDPSISIRSRRDREAVAWRFRLDHFAAYLPFFGHDASPLEKAAEDQFGKKMYDDFKAAGLDKKCRF